MTAGLPAAPRQAERLTTAREVVMSSGPALALAARPDDRPDVSDAWREALFASALQPSDALTAEAVAQAIGSTVRQFGIGGCAGRMAQEFGDHPEAAVERMRWVCSLAAETPVLDTGAATAGPLPRLPGGKCSGRVRPARARPRPPGRTAGRVAHPVAMARRRLELRPAGDSALIVS